MNLNQADQFEQPGSGEARQESEGKENRGGQAGAGKHQREENAKEVAGEGSKSDRKGTGTRPGSARSKDDNGASPAGNPSPKKTEQRERT